MWSVGNKFRGRRAPSSAMSISSLHRVAIDQAGCEPWTASVSEFGDAFARLTDELGQRSGNEVGAARIKTLRVWIGGALCKPVRLMPVAAQLRGGERRRVAEAAAIAQAGLTPPCRVWVDTTAAADNDVAVVIEQVVLDGLASLESSLGVHLDAISPWWGEVLRHALVDRPGLQALGVLDDGAFTLLGGSGDKFSVARTTSSVRDAQSANAILLRVGMSEDIDPAQSLGLGLDFEAPPVSANAAIAGLSELAFARWVRALEPLA